MLKRLHIAILILLSTAVFACAAELKPSAELSAGSAPFETKIRVDNPSDAFLLIDASSPDTSWASREPEGRAVVLNVQVDARSAGQIVLYGGDTTMPYSATLGPLDPGMHDLSIMFDENASPAKQARAVISAMDVKFVDQGNHLYDVYRHSPILYLYGGDPTTDVPLLIFYTVIDKGASKTIQYEVVFSNEDGGTGGIPLMLMAQYGRMTDIEWTYQVTLNRNSGKILTEIYQGPGHVVHAFTGEKVGRHPLLRVATKNGNFDQDGATGIRTGLMPVSFVPGERPRDAVMDDFPWLARISNQEMIAERKARRNNNEHSPFLSDLRDYIYVDCHAHNHNGQRTLVFKAQVGEDGDWYTSDPGEYGMIIGTKPNAGRAVASGWFRTNIRMPRGTRPEDITAFRFVGMDDVDYTIYEVHAFMLNSDYTRGPDLFEFSGNAHLTPETDVFHFPVVHQ